MVNAARLANGEDVRAISDEIGVSLSTVQKWKDAEEAEPSGVAPPPLPATKGKRAKRQPRRPITEETAGKLCAGIFALVATLDGLDGTDSSFWFLSDVERQALAGPMADSLSVLPTSVADAVNTYSAPAIFVTSFAAVVKHKMGMRKNAKRGHLRAVVNLAPRPQSVPTQSTPQPTPPPVTPTSQLDLGAALAAMHGSLADNPSEEETLLR